MKEMTVMLYFGGLVQGCPNYGLWAKCGPASIFNWPVSKTKNIGDYGLNIIFALKVEFTLRDSLVG